MDPVMDRTSVALGVAAVAIGAAAAAACRAGVAMLAAVAVLLLAGGCAATGATGAGGEAVQRLHQAQQQAATTTVDVGPEVDSAGTVWVLIEFAISHGGYTSAEHVATLRTRSMCQRAAAEVDARAQPPSVVWHAARCQPMPNPDMFPEPAEVGAKPKARRGGV